MTHTDFFALAQDNITGLAQRVQAQERAAQAAARQGEQRRAANEAERVAEVILTRKDQMTFTVLAGAANHGFYRDVAHVLRQARTDIKVVWVIEQREGGPRTSNYYAYKGEFGQIAQHLKRRLSSYCNEHMETF